MALMTHATFHFNRLMVTLIFGIPVTIKAPGPGERLKRPGLIGLRRARNHGKMFQKLCQTSFGDIYNCLIPISQTEKSSGGHKDLNSVGSLFPLQKLI